MTPKNIIKFTNSELLGIIDSAKKSEYTRDISSLQDYLQPVWHLLESDDECEDFEVPITAELLRLYGFYLTFHGRARNLKDYQDRAKDVITRAIALFESQNLDQKVAESNITLGFCYWNRGEVREAEAIYELVENDFAENKISPVYLQLQINRLMLLCWDCRFEESYEIFQDIESLMPFCKDMRLRIMFHFESGILMHRLEKYNQATVHFTESIALCKKEDNQFLLALNYNNFSLLYLDLNDYENAHYLSDESLDLLKKNRHFGWIAHIYDSKALIYLKQNKSAKSLAMVNEALEYFNRGEDFKGLVSSMWTKIRCLLKIGKTEEALSVFAVLHRTARENVAEALANRYAAKLSEELYAVRELPLLDEVAQFKKSQIRKALIKSNLKISTAAKILGLKNHQTLSDILDKQFPELYKELDFKRRERKQSETGSKTKALKTQDVKPENARRKKTISRVHLQNKNLAFDFDLNQDDFDTFCLDKSLMIENFGVNSDAIIAISPVKLSESSIGRYILINNDESFTVGKLDYDEWTTIYYLLDSDNAPQPFKESQLRGQVIGYCPIAETGDVIIKFSKL